MRIGRVLLTAGILLSLGAGALGSVVGGSASDTAEVKIRLVEPLTVIVSPINFGTYVRDQSLNGVSETSMIEVKGEAGMKVDLDVSSENGGNLENQDGEGKIAIDYSIAYDKNVDLGNGMTTRTLTAKITESGTDHEAGNYIDTITVTATYQ